MARNTIGKSLVAGGLGDLMTSYGELGLDSLLEDGVLKDIPFLGTLVGIYRTKENVKEYLFSQKVESFVTNLKGVPTEEVNDFNYKIESDPEFREQVARHLTLTLDRLDDIEKTSFIAKAFSALITNKIDFNKFKRVVRAIDRCMIEDLAELHNFERANDAHHEITHDLAACGLIELVQLPVVSAPNVNPMYRITASGEEFVRLVLTE